MRKIKLKRPGWWNTIFLYFFMWSLKNRSVGHHVYETTKLENRRGPDRPTKSDGLGKGPRTNRDNTDGTQTKTDR